MADYSKRLYVGSNKKDFADIIDDYVVTIKPTKTSQLTNNSSFTTSSGSASSATNVTSATTITAGSGVSAGTYGQSGNTTLNNNTISVIVPQITVNNKGQITSVVNRTLTITSY